MIIELMGYTTAVSLLLGLAALAVEGTFALAAWPRRWVWAVAMVISLAGSATMALRPHLPPTRSEAARTPVTTPATRAVRGIPLPALVIAAQPLRAGGSAGAPVWASVETYAKWSWLGASSLLLGVYLVGALHLVRSRRQWPQRTVGGFQVLVTENVGPAVFGLIRPAIVVPRWLLEETAATRDAALAHENQHIIARDPVLLLAALLLFALAPWNLPLWWQLRRLKLAIEVDCDARVLSAGVDRRLYASTLLCVNQFAGKLPIGAVAIVGRASQAERRIRAMMTAPSRQRRLWVLGFAIAAIPLLVLAAELNPPSSAPETPRVYLGIGLADFDVNGGATSIAAVRYRGAIVTYVNRGSVADQAGLKRGDVITKFGDTSIIGARMLAAAVGHTAPEARVPVVIQRGSQNQTLLADFSTAPPARPQSAGRIVDTSDWDSLRDANLPISEPGLRDELIRMSKLDEYQRLLQSAAKTPLPQNTSAMSIGLREEPRANEANVRRLREIIAQHGWPTVSMVGVRGATAAGMIASSARSDPAFQAEALRLMEPLLQRDEVPAMFYAGLYDSVHKSQRFGMMMECVKGVIKPSKPLEDPQHLDERRAALGLPKLPQFCNWTIGPKSGP
jgi:hypothetical protein